MKTMTLEFKDDDELELFVKAYVHATQQYSRFAYKFSQENSDSLKAKEYNSRSAVLGWIGYQIESYGLENNKNKNG